MKHYLTAESVCQGHPDKLCDFIADSILDAYLEADPYARVACEVMATKGKIIVAGEITSTRRVFIPGVVRTALQIAGYDPKGYSISLYIHTQSPDIAAGVDTALETRQSSSRMKELGAGDQGTVVGYATNETHSMIPLPLELSHRMCKSLDDHRAFGTLSGIKSDGKAQVTVEYEDDIPKRIDTIIVSVQHKEDTYLDLLKNEITNLVIRPACVELSIDADTHILINPSGKFTEGGPAADTGITGRKIMVDTYGGLAHHGGGAFSGKDPTKVDRSGAYMARFIAKHIVAAGLAERCEVSISYAIGKAYPVALSVETFGTGAYHGRDLTWAVKETFDLRPQNIIEELSLRAPIYSHTARYGHMGNSLYPWEHILPSYLAALKGALHHDR